MKKLILTLIMLMAVTVTDSLAQWSQATLPTARYRMGSASLGTRVYFAGGTNSTWNSTDIVDIYDFSTNQWTTANLSAPRDLATVIAVGNLVFFAGGIDFNTGTLSSVVDILDVNTNQWTTAQLSLARFGAVALSDGNKVLFAGGVEGLSGPVTDVVDIYNISTNTWSTDFLWEPSSAMAAAVVGTKAFFAGGYKLASGGVSNVVNIYDFSTDTWAMTTLTQARGFATAASVGNWLVIGGGMIASDTATDLVEIYDNSTAAWTTAHLSAPRCWMESTTAAFDSNIVFAGGAIVQFSSNAFHDPINVVDIYNPVTNIWSTATPYNPPVMLNSVVANKNHVLVAGGLTVSSGITSSVHIYTFAVTSINELGDNNQLQFYPNPAITFVNVQTSNLKSHTFLMIYNINGELILQQEIVNNLTQVDVSMLQNGMYFLRLQNNDSFAVGKLFKQ